jgi:hypothetical protein
MLGRPIQSREEIQEQKAFLSDDIGEPRSDSLANNSAYHPSKGIGFFRNMPNVLRNEMSGFLPENDLKNLTKVSIDFHGPIKNYRNAWAVEACLCCSSHFCCSFDANKRANRASFQDILNDRASYPYLTTSLCCYTMFGCQEQPILIEGVAKYGITKIMNDSPPMSELDKKNLFKVLAFGLITIPCWMPCLLPFQLCKTLTSISAAGCGFFAGSVKDTCSNIRPYKGQKITLLTPPAPSAQVMRR